MDADRAHALVARFLTEPAFRTAVLEHAHRPATAPSPADGDGTSGDAALAAALVEPAELERLALFAGFITKVKHNPLRPVLPCTLRLLALLGDEIRFFALYSSAYGEERARGPLSLERQVELLGRHLEAFLADRPARIRALIGDVLAHEAALARAAAQVGAASAHEDSAGIRWRGWFSVERYRVDVAQACGALHRRTFDFETDLVERDQLLAYWLPAGAQEVSFFEIDELTNVLFGLADGRRTARDIAAALAALGLEAIGPADVDTFFAEAAARGFVEIGAPACS